MNSFQSIKPKQAVSDQERLSLWEQRQNMESFLQELRARGAGQIDCIKAVREIAGISLGEAKEIVHYSRTWADMREASEALHETAYKALEIMQRKQDAEQERIAS